MKTVDVSDRVMKKVVRFERNRITVWLRNFALIVFALVIGGSAVFVLVVRDLLEKRAFDLFELFFQDPEIISEFWREVLETFWEELPQGLLVVIMMMLIALCMVVIITKRKRAVLGKKLRQLEKYK